MNWYWLGEPFLYCCVAILFGSVVIPRVQSQIVIPVRVSIFAAAGIVLFAFLPVLRIVHFFSGDIPFGLVFKNVMLTFVEGQAYIWTLFLSVLFMTVVLINKTLSKNAFIIQLILAVGIVATLSWSSHASSYFGALGFWAQFVHFLSITIWAGILLTAGIFMPGKGEQWKAFLSWYHLIAMISMIFIILSGLLLNMKTAPDYFNSWISSYGQSLLVKHLFIIPLIFIAFFNGFLMKRKLKNINFNPKSWVLVEGVFILLIFSVTGFMNQQPAPHDMDPQLLSLSANKLFFWFAQEGNVQVPLNFSIHLTSILLYVLAVASLLAMVIFFVKNKSAIYALLFGLLFTTFSFFGVMMLLN